MQRKGRKSKMFEPGYCWDAHVGGCSKKDPFSPENRIPLPSEVEENGVLCNWTGVNPLPPLALEPPGVRKRNERERERVRSVNEGFERLKRCLPVEVETKRKVAMSKVEVLRETIVYIRHLESELKRRGKGRQPMQQLISRVTQDQ